MTGGLWVRPFEELMAVAHEIYQRAVAVGVHDAVETARRAAGAPGGRWSPRREQRVRESAQARYLAEFADVPGLFQAFVDGPDPDRFTPAIASLEQVQQLLAVSALAPDPLTGTVIPAQEAFARILTTGGFLAGWSGDAARAGKANFLDPLPAKIGGQCQVAAILRAAVQAEQAIWRAARADIRTIAAKARAALDHVGDLTQTEWTVTFTVLASIAAVGAAPLSGGASVALTAVGATASVVAAVPVDVPSEVTYGAGTVTEVIDQLRHAVRELIARINRAEQLIAEHLDANIATINAHWRQFVPARPELANATGAEVTSSRYFGFAH